MKYLHAYFKTNKPPRLFSEKIPEDLICKKHRTLRKILKFHLMFGCGNFVETHGFYNLSKTLPKVSVSAKFSHQEIKQIYARYFMHRIYIERLINLFNLYFINNSCCYSFLAVDKMHSNYLHWSLMYKCLHFDLKTRCFKKGFRLNEIYRRWKQICETLLKI